MNGGVAAGAHPSADGRIELHGLSKSFPGPDGPIEAVRGIDVEIAAGETVALLGPNGAGKSTTIDMLLGLLTPDAGKLSVFGRSPSQAVSARLFVACPHPRRLTRAAVPSGTTLW